MKYKTHKYLQVSAIVILCLAAYVSMKQVEGFQATDMPNYATLDELVNSVNGYWYSTGPSWHTSEMADKELRIKNNMKNSYSEHTALMNEAFDKSKTAGDRYDVTINKLYTATLNHISKSSAPGELKLNMMFLQGYADSIMKGQPPNIPYIPNWFVGLQPKAELLYKAMEAKFGPDTGGPPPPDKLNLFQTINGELDKILINIFNASKSTDERDDETATKVLNAQIEFIENYRMPVAPSAATPSAATTPAVTPSAATPSTTSTSLSNTNMYIGIGVGSVVLIGIIGYFMFSAAPATAGSS